MIPKKYNPTPFQEMIEGFYNVLDGQEYVGAYHDRHGVNSAQILTVTDDETAHLISSHLAERIKGKRVIEIGGGVGLLAMHMAQYAERVIVIEADPAWTDVFLATLYTRKPKNVTFIFGAADEVVGMIRGDVALFCTHSDHDGMKVTAERFAPVVIDVYREIISKERETEILAQHIKGETDEMDL